MAHRRHGWGTVAGGAVAALLLSGCGGLSDEQVSQAAADFAGGDPAGRCELLAPATLAALEEESASCEDAIAGLPLGSGEVESVHVWGEEAQAKLSDDTLFLTRTRSGWRIMAGACTPQGEDKPYECQLEGS